MYVVEAVDLHKSFGDVKAVNGVSFKVREGRYTVY
jgi:ABC-type multidrug transport system ATPase subunit